MTSRLTTCVSPVSHSSQLLRMGPARGAFIQRKCACNESGGPNAKCEECSPKGLNLQRRDAGQAAPFKAPAIVKHVLSSPGHSLDNDGRAQMEARFGHDFSRVRVHTDGPAAESAQAVNALAYSVGHQIVFGANQYSPGSEAGRRLLAHELAHTIQQGEVGDVTNSLTISNSTDSLEREADAAAAAAVGGDKVVGSLGNTAPFLARQDNPDPTSTTPTTTPTQEPSAAGNKDAGSTDAVPPDAAPADAGTKPPPPSKKVCLTFDDGPKDPGTQDVLNALGSSIKATFFLQGSKMVASDRLMHEGDKLIAAETKQAELVAQILAKGHQIANHTFWHVPFKQKEYDALTAKPQAEQDATIREGFTKNLEYFKGLYERHKEAFAQAGITEFPGFQLGRLPGHGKFYPPYVALVEGLGLKHVGWNSEFAPKGGLGAPLGTSNWKGVSGLDAEVKSHACPGTNWILLLHDTLWGGKQALLDAFIGKLKTDCGCEFGVLDQGGKCS
ncbi:MAG: DUF4157 domain-containing protein [Pyrinomonadaceae bacterium]|nr:DUF4157 domain-containing protein [Pyrinomonadaceae bacterium]